MQRIIPILILAAIPSLAQYQPQRTTRGRSASNGIGDTGAYHDPAATMHGVLKRITNKEITIIGDGDQLVEIVRTHKTKFLRNGKEVKPTEIAVGSILSIDVGKLPDLSPQALNVVVDSPPIEGAPAVHAKFKNSGGDMDQEEPVSAAPGTAAAPASNSSAAAQSTKPTPAAKAPAQSPKSPDSEKPMDQEERVPTQQPAATPSKPPAP